MAFFSLDYNFLYSMSEQTRPLLTKTILILAAAIGICLCLLTLLIQYLVFPNIVIESKEKLQLKITPISATSNSQGQETGQTNQQVMTETPSMPGVIGLGMNILVNGTGNEGLRIHSDAGIDMPTIYLGQEGEHFKIIDGPKILDGLIWWKIEGTEDKNKVGWSVQDYMKAN